jgi:hypothetical protein
MHTTQNNPISMINILTNQSQFKLRYVTPVCMTAGYMLYTADAITWHFNGAQRLVTGGGGDSIITSRT